MFERHELIPEEDGFLLILYIQTNVTEFALEMEESMNIDERNSRLLKAKVMRYIRENLPDIKITKVKIMMESVVLGIFKVK